jgi:peptidoglycan/LPS O-acetylase OafA/YrhL
VDFYSIWPAMVLLAALFLLVATPLFQAADSPPIPARSRVSTLDGLRGFLALSVFLHHGAVYHSFIQDSVWRTPPDRLYGLLGSFGVSIFFMITGFLFWSQILDKKGRPDWVRLYVGRVFRIGPIYLVAAAIMVCAVFAVTGLHLRVPAGSLAWQLAQWSALGFRSGIPINGYPTPGAFLAYVTWSLRWEWFFYASLIVTALFARNSITSWALPTTGLLVSLAALLLSNVGEGPQTAAFVALFCVGMVTAALRPLAARTSLQTPIFSAVAAILLLTVLAIFRTAYDAAAICLLGGAFFLIANGTSLFGLLTSRPARRLGDVSFGIYLLQGLVMSAVFASPQARQFALASPLQHWALLAIAGVALVSVATVAHALIERPGVELGRSFVGVLGRKPAIA